MEQLSFWLYFLMWIIIFITLYGVLKILVEKTPDSSSKKITKKQDDDYESTISFFKSELRKKLAEIAKCKNKLHHDYGLTLEEIDNYIKEQKEEGRVRASKIRAQWTFNEIKTLENLIEIKESEKKAKVLFPNIKKRDLEDEKEDFKTKTQYKIIFGLINLYNQDYEEINFSNRIGLLDIHIYEVSEDERYVVNNQLETDISDIFPNSIAIENGNSWEIINDIPKVYYDTIDFTGEHNHAESFEEEEYNMALNFIKNLKIIPFKKAKELGILDLN